MLFYDINIKLKIISEIMNHSCNVLTSTLNLKTCMLSCVQLKIDNNNKNVVVRDTHLIASFDVYNECYKPTTSTDVCFQRDFLETKQKDK